MCVYLLCGVQEVLSWGAFVLGAFVLGAFVVHLLSEAPKSTDGGCVAWVCVIT